MNPSEDFSNKPISSYSVPSGPENPFKNTFGKRNMKVEKTSIDNFAFESQYGSYQRHGYAIDSSDGRVIGDVENFKKNEYSLDRPNKKARGPQQIELGDDDDESDGPWMKFEAPKFEFFPPQLNNESTTKEKKATESPSEETEKSAQLSKPDVETTPAHVQMLMDPTLHIVEPDEEDEKWELVNERKSKFTLPPRPPRGSVPAMATSSFHGEAEFDYQGRPWSHPPSGMRSDGGNHDCFLPKKCIKKYLGHTKGVNAIEFSPGVGHLLLSASMDGKCKIWDVYGDRNVKRTYQGHTESVRSVNFSGDGRSFLSSGFDRYMRLWDVETGQCKGTFTNRKVGYQVRYAPTNPNIFLVPSNDNKIYQWDIRSGNVVLEYNHHLQAVNCVTFFDDGEKFVSTSDDKKVLVWEYDTPVPIKYIQDPELFSLPYVSLHPSGKFLAGQSMNNSVVIYKCEESVSATKKTFRGHQNAGYACQVSFSPNGRHLVSGDGHGKLFIWDWKTCQIGRKFQAHENGPCLGAVWHPLQPSWVATCGWDGVIKLWD